MWSYNKAATASILTQFLQQMSVIRSSAVLLYYQNRTITQNFYTANASEWCMLVAVFACHDQRHTLMSTHALTPSPIWRLEICIDTHTHTRKYWIPPSTGWWMIDFHWMELHDQAPCVRVCVWKHHDLLLRKDKSFNTVKDVFSFLSKNMK